ncbi:hypothetical protein [Oenococcus oeni]|uniref:hypothetical protein n=1 Tax=Oenococcus oeni TaxID=1247 RepID=UPI0010BAC7BE|nr:hypothetical protein [Oenococcus oeni]SYW16234.1 hypothetical protein OENI_30066 [Oenococcus oeni]
MIAGVASLSNASSGINKGITETFLKVGDAMATQDTFARSSSLISDGALKAFKESSKILSESLAPTISAVAKLNVGFVPAFAKLQSQMAASKPSLDAAYAASSKIASFTTPAGNLQKMRKRNYAIMKDNEIDKIVDSKAKEIAPTVFTRSKMKGEIDRLHAPNDPIGASTSAVTTLMVEYVNRMLKDTLKELYTNSQNKNK